MQAQYRKPTTACQTMAASCATPHDAAVASCLRNTMRKQRGASAIEFALVFPLFFLIFYAIITYGLIMVAQQSVTLAAAEGARAALRHAADDAARHENARAAAIGDQSVAAWLGTEHLSFSPTQASAPIVCPYASGSDPAHCYEVTVSYPYRQRPLVPLLLGPLMHVVIPDTLSSTAIVQLN